MIKKVFSD